MMSYMEVATYLGLLNTALAGFNFSEEMESASEGEKNINNKMIEALISAQMVMYELARQELQEAVEGGDKNV